MGLGARTKPPHPHCGLPGSTVCRPSGSPGPGSSAPSPPQLCFQEQFQLRERTAGDTLTVPPSLSFSPRNTKLPDFPPAGERKTRYIFPTSLPVRLPHGQENRVSCLVCRPWRLPSDSRCPRLVLPDAHLGCPPPKAPRARALPALWSLD